MWDLTGKGMGTTFDTIISLVVLANILVMGLYYWERLPHGHVMELASDCSMNAGDKCEITALQVSDGRKKGFCFLRPRTNNQALTANMPRMTKPTNRRTYVRTYDRPRTHSRRWRS